MWFTKEQLQEMNARFKHYDWYQQNGRILEDPDCLAEDVEHLEIGEFYNEDRAEIACEAVSAIFWLTKDLLELMN